MARKKVLVTGANGFIGEHLVACLSQKNDVQLRIFDRQKHSLEDVESLKELAEGSTHVFHLAGITNSADPHLFKVNVLGTLNLLEVLAEQAPEARLVFSSSFAVYKVPKSGEKIDENFPLQLRNKYGLSKLLAEEIIQFYAEVGKVNAAILRLSNVYGLGMPPFKHSVVATIFKLIEEGKEITIDGDGSQTRDFIFVEDVVEAMVLTAFNTRLGNLMVINICSGEETSLNDLIREIEEVTGERANISYNRKADSSKGGFWQGDNVLAKRLLSWEPKVFLEKGLRAI